MVQSRASSPKICGYTEPRVSILLNAFPRVKKWSTRTWTRGWTGSEGGLQNSSVPLLCRWMPTASGWVMILAQRYFFFIAIAARRRNRELRDLWVLYMRVACVSVSTTPSSATFDAYMMA